MRQYASEFLGTFFLMFAVIFSGEAWAIGLIFAAMIYIGSHVSGGYYNPAISCALWLRGRLSSEQFLGYSISQVAGAFLASLYFFWISSDHFILELPAGVMFTDVAMREVVLTFFLCMVVLTLATTARYSGSNKVGLIAGLALAAIATIGGLYNPAIFLGAMVCNLLGSAVPSGYNILTFVAAPLVGAALSTYVYAYLNPNEL